MAVKSASKGHSDVNKTVPSEIRTKIFLGKMYNNS